MPRRVLPFLACFLIFSCAGSPPGRGTSVGGSSGRPESQSIAGTAGSAAAAQAEPGPGSVDNAASKTGRLFPEPFRPSFALDGLVFAVADPVLRWEPLPEGSSLRIQVSKDESFSEADMLIDAETGGSSYRLGKPLEAEKTFYARARRKAAGGSWEAWTPAARLSYRPLVVDLLPIIGSGKTATFVMGWNQGTARGRPEHRVVLTRPYALGRFEVTNGLFAEVANRFLATGDLSMKDGNLAGPDGTSYLGLGDLNYGRQIGLEAKDGRLFPRERKEDHPVSGVTWQGAVAFCNGLSVLFGLDPVYDAKGKPDFSAGGFRLPTEAEWEYAARGDRGWLFPQGSGLDNRAANYFKNWDPFEPVDADMAGRGGPTTPVGFFDGRIKNGFRTRDGSGPFGNADMLGNVWEWCWDAFDAGYYEASPRTDPEGPAEGDTKVVRGCGWNTQADDVVLTNRGFYKPDGKSWSIGLRIARTLIP